MSAAALRPAAGTSRLRDLAPNPGPAAGPADPAGPAAAVRRQRVNAATGPS